MDVIGRRSRWRLSGGVLACWLCALALPGAARAAEADETVVESDAIVLDLRFEGARRVPREPLRAALRFLQGETASRTNLLRAVEVLEKRPNLGGVDVELQPRDEPPGVVASFHFDGHRRLVESLALAVEDTEGPPAASPELLRKVRASGPGLQLNEGRPFHPYLLHLDTQSVRRYFVARGHLDVEVAELVLSGDDLTSVSFLVRPGPRYRLGKVRVIGTELDPETRRRVLSSARRKKSPVVPWRLEEDARRLRQHLCLQGHPKASVRVEQIPDPEALTAVTFHVDSGPRQRLGDVTLEGGALFGLDEHNLGLVSGGPYCGDLVERAVRGIVARMKELGYPGAKVDVLAEPAGPSPNDRVALRLRLRPGPPARVTHIWFEGNVVTRRSVLLELITLKVGDLARQSELDRSVQNLRASGLFRSASARLVPSEDGQRHYVSFRVVERGPLTVEPGDYSATLHNLDLYGLPSSVDEAVDGVSLRGRGQQLWIKATDDWVALRLRDPFLAPLLVTSAQIDRRVYTYDGLEETAWSARLGVGYNELSNRLELLGLLLAEYTMVDAPSAYATLPVPTDSTFKLAAGFEFRWDRKDRDDERIAYRGLGLKAQLLSTGVDFRESAADWTDLRLGISGHIPLYTTRRGQHFVLQLSAAGAWLLTDEGDPAPAHRRITPSIRGWSTSAMRIPRTVDGDEVRLGATRAYTATVGVRFPLFWRRNGVTLFVDGAAVGDLDSPAWDLGRKSSAGIRVDVSLFDESLEGWASFAVPLEEDVDTDYIAAGAGGSF